MQATATETWRQKILDEHRELEEKILELRSTLRKPRPELGTAGSHVWASEVSRKLVDLHDQLCRHFRYEEESGMMEDLMKRHPRASGQVDELRAEHSEMLAESRELVALLMAYSEDSKSAGVGLRRRLGALLDLLGQHERHENSLIMDLAYSDLGLGD